MRCMHVSLLSVSIFIFLLLFFFWCIFLSDAGRKIPMTTSNGVYPSAPSVPPPLLPPWLSSSTAGRPPSVTLSLSSSTPSPWDSPSLTLGSLQPHHTSDTTTSLVSELSDCCRELEEGHRAWSTYKKESAWGLKRLELQLESEKARRRQEKIDEVEAKIAALREEQKVVLERIDAEYGEQVMGLRRDAEAKDQKLAEQWAAKHARLTNFLEQMGCRTRIVVDPTGR